MVLSEQFYHAVDYFTLYKIAVLFEFYM